MLLSTLFLSLLAIQFAFIPVNVEEPKYEFIDVIIRGNKPIIKGRLNGKIIYLMLDTGSDITIFDSDEITKYDFDNNLKTITHNQKTYGVYSSQDKLDEVKKFSVKVGSQQLMGRYFCANLKELRTAIKKNTGLNISGIIGMDMILKYDFLIDFDQKRVRVRVYE